jgi:hypothetical protein
MQYPVEHVSGSSAPAISSSDATTVELLAQESMQRDSSACRSMKVNRTWLEVAVFALMLHVFKSSVQQLRSATACPSAPLAVMKTRTTATNRTGWIRQCGTVSVDAIQMEGQCQHTDSTGRNELLRFTGTMLMCLTSDYCQYQQEMKSISHRALAPWCARNASSWTSLQGSAFCWRFWS